MGILKNLNFFLKFLIFSGVAILILAVSIMVIVPANMRNDIFSKHAHMVSDILASALSHHFSQETFKEPFSTENKAELDNIISSIIANGELEAIKILNTDREVLYSCYITGKDKIKDRSFIKSLSGEVTHNIVKAGDLNLTRTQNNDNNDLLMQIYSPIFYPDKNVRGVFEIYVGIEELNKDILKTKLTIFGIVIASSLIFYGLLLGIAKNASNKIESQTKQLLEDFIKTTAVLGELIEIRDHYTGQHVKNVKEISDTVGKKMGLDQNKIEDLKLAASLHDIGKIGISDEILNKKGPLTEKEYEIIKKHPLTGAYAIRNIGRLKSIYKIILYHHERYDGKGYPFGLKENEIPLCSRILSVMGAYDAMTSNRPYRKAMPVDEAIKIIKSEKGKQFDPEVVDAFTSYMSQTH
jgi:HD-GYP domain-containing protein (c-di-GMP phosphodiesterase class II)